MLFWFIAIPLLWIRPQWKLLAVLCVAQIILLVAFVWGASGFYRDAIERYPEIMSEHWASLLASVPLNVGLFAVVGSLVVLGRKLVLDRSSDVKGDDSHQEQSKGALHPAHQRARVNFIPIRRLSGWSRLWIVCAVLIWAGGGWWLRENPPTQYSSAYGFGCTVENYIGWGAPDPRDMTAYDECIAAEGRYYLSHKEAIDAADARGERDYQWRFWSRIAAVVLAPFLAGLVFWTLILIVRWVRSGFRPQSN